MATLLLMVAMTLTVRALSLAGTQRRAADRRLWAVQSAANVVERVTSEPFDRVTADRARSVAAGTKAGDVLPGAAWEVSVENDPGAPVAAKKVAVRLSWKDKAGNAESPVRLTAWVYRGRGGS
jgi:hypothetical protein